MDNFHFNIVARGNLAGWFEKIFNTSKAVGFMVDNNVLIFFKYSYPKMQAFPFKMDAEQAAKFAEQWLAQSAEYGDEPDHDGHNSKGWCIYNDENWDHVHGMYQGLLAVKPVWAMHGK